MKDKGIVITYVVVVVLGIIFTVFGFGKKDVSEDVSKKVSEERYILDPLTNNALENVVLIHTLDYNYLGEVDTIEHDWLIHNEPEYMLDVIEACAVVIDSYYNGNIPTEYYYSNSDKYSYLNTDTDICLLTPEDSYMNELIVEVTSEKVYLYEVYAIANNKSYISNDIREKLESVDASEEVVSDTNYRTLTDEELKHIVQICSEYDIDVDKSIVEFDITTDTYIVRSEQATVFIDLSTGEVDVEYTKYINY